MITTGSADPSVSTVPSTPGILRRAAGRVTGPRRLHFAEGVASGDDDSRNSASQRLEAIASHMRQQQEAAAAAAAAAEAGPAGGGGGIGPARSMHWPPSRRREEASALRNLRRALANRELREPVKDTEGNNDIQKAAARLERMQLDNRPLLQKILQSRPVTVAADEDEGRTDWHNSELISECLCWHNVYRQRHGSPDLTMCPQLCAMAQSWANQLAHTNSFFYRSDLKDVGQNLYCRLPSSDNGDVAGQEVAAHWYSACRQYNYFKEPDVLHANVNAGHFTQLVWASTRYFGLGKARSRSGKLVVVATYRPAGNISGKFQQNVFPPKPGSTSGSASASVSASVSDSNSTTRSADWST